MGEREDGQIRIESEWEQLIRGKTVGKRVGISFTSGRGLETSGQNMFTIGGENEDAIPLTVTLVPPEGKSGISADVARSGVFDSQNPQEIAKSWTWANPFARIEWGIGGVSTGKVEVDVHNGAMLSISASFVRIAGFVEDPVETVESGGYSLAAFIGPGRDKGIGCQRTIFWDQIVTAIDTESPPMRVPLFARRVRLCGFADLATTFLGSIVFYRGTRGGGATGLRPICEYMFASNTPESFPVPNGAYWFTIVRRTTPSPVNAAAIFDLAI